MSRNQRLLHRNTWRKYTPLLTMTAKYDLDLTYLDLDTGNIVFRDGIGKPSTSI